MLNEFATVMIFKITTLTIKQMQLKAKLDVSILIGPPPNRSGRRVLTNHGPPKHMRMSSVLAPSALLIVIDPIPEIF